MSTGVASECAQNPTISPTDANSPQPTIYDNHAPGASSSSPPYAVSKAEALLYYSSISPTPPKLVYRTGKTPWIEPTGPEACPRLKQLCGVFGHKLNDVWKDLGSKVHDLLDSQGVLFTSINIIRFLNDGEGEVVGPVILWIGVCPNTLLSKDAFTSANGCLDLLATFGITDVEVEYQESVYTWWVGPGLLESIGSKHPLVNECGPLTPALGLSISALARPDAQGTMGLYLSWTW